jgi:putative redox protein
MSVEMNIVDEGDLHCRATHGPSGSVISTDAPTDNGGRGAAFSPTDLMGTALGTCALTLMGLAAQRSHLDIAGTRVHVVKEMVALPVRRIGALKVTITVPADKAAKLSPADRTRLENAARTCPVHKSLHPDIDAPITFVYET